MDRALAKTEENKNADSFDLSKIYVWIRGIESKLNNLRRELDLLKMDSAKKYEKLGKEVKVMSTDILEIKREREKVIEKMDLIIKELKLTAGKEEVLILKKYIDLWNPMNFATQRDVERLVEEKISQLKTEEPETKV